MFVNAFEGGLISDKHSGNFTVFTVGLRVDKDNIAIANTGIDHAVPLAAQGKIGVASDGSGDIVFDIFFRENGNPAGDAAHQRDHILLVAGIIPPHQLRGSDSENFRQRFNNGNGKLFDFMAFIAIERCTGNAQLIGKHDIIGEILEYRMLTKLKSTYAEGLLKVIAPDGRIHTNFQMTVTATGRLSSTEPNLQNIPIRKSLGAQIRRMFVAAPGNSLVDADYSQNELRLLAHISGDAAMQEAFLSGEDFHAVTAAKVFNLPLEEVTPTLRSRAKAVNFGIVYGISAFSLAQDIHVHPYEAKEYMDAYLEKYHGVRDYMKKIVEQAKEDGYVTTLYGRRRDLPELKSGNFNTRAFGERVALNMPIQGTAADIIKIAMVNVAKRLRDEGLQARLILQVHDELIAECPEEETEMVKKILQEEMEGAVRLSVPLTCEAKSGKNWAEAH